MNVKGCHRLLAFISWLLGTMAYQEAADLYDLAGASKQ